MVPPGYVDNEGDIDIVGGAKGKGKEDIICHKCGQPGHAILLGTAPMQPLIRERGKEKGNGVSPKRATYAASRVILLVNAGTTRQMLRANRDPRDSRGDMGNLGKVAGRDQVIHKSTASTWALAIAVI